MTSRPWLPPAALVGAQLASGASWALLGALAVRGDVTLSLPALAWVHLVALGWLTLTALAILFHVVPGFLDTPVRAEGLARIMLWVFMGGVAVMVAGFWGPRPVWIAWGGAAVGIGLIGVGGPMVMTIATYAIARRRTLGPSTTPFVVALSAVFVALALATGIGLAMAGGLAGWWSGAALALAAAHAHLAAGGWLTLLVMGVSMRTLVRITGVRRARPFLHIAAATGFLAGIAALAAGLAIDTAPLTFAGAALCALAALAYVLDAGRMVFTSRDPHLPARAFLGSALAYLLVTVALGLLILSGRPGLAPAYAFVALAGWLGQMVSGHLHHIGVRFLLTQVRGEEDDTEPVEALSTPLSWITWATAQAAILSGTIGLVMGASAVLEVAAAFGLVSWLIQIAHIIRVVRASGHAPVL